MYIYNIYIHTIYSVQESSLLQITYDIYIYITYICV